MNWKLRALLLRGMATLPGGYGLYQLLQHYMGVHRQPGYVAYKLGLQRELAVEVLESGGFLTDARVMEVGSGWVPLLPLGFWICGAKEVRTFDLNRHLLPGVLRDSMRWMVENEAALVELWKGVATADRVRWCLLRMRERLDRPMELLREAGIEYCAPADAARTGLPDGSVDVHYSLSVLEHIPGGVIQEILREARRLLAPEGRFVHRVDPTDHFSHFDPSITRINFLQFDEAQWKGRAGNYLAYHNRLRDPDFERLFRESGLSLLAHRFVTDDRSLEALQQGLVVAPEFRDVPPERLCRHRLTFVGANSEDTLSHTQTRMAQ